jgi:uncharacterized membrane protein YfcA
MVLVLLGVGVGVGFISGLLGIAGGVILVPALLKIESLLGIPVDTAVKIAFGSSLLTGFFTSISGTWQHHRESNIRWHDAIPLTVAGTAGALIGSTVSSYLPGSVLKPLFGVAVMVVAVILVFRPEREESAASTRHPLVIMSFVGGAIGALSALVGIGGGVMLIPFMTLLLGYPARQAVGTSAAVIPLIVFSGAIGYIVHGWREAGLPAFSAGYVNLWFVLCVSLSSMLVAPLGAKVGTMIHGKWLNRLFALLLVFVAFKMFGF